MKRIILISLSAFSSLFFSGTVLAEEPLKVIVSDGAESGEGGANGLPPKKIYKIEHPTQTNVKTRKLLKVAGAQGDPLAAAFSLPGVLISEDGEPAVRGSSPEDNNYMVDFLPAGNVYHAFGFSIFNKDLLADFTLIPAAAPAEYNYATGAVFDITTRDPRPQEWEYVVDTSFLLLGIKAEGEIKPGHNAYFSYRKSLLDLFIEDGERDEEEDTVIAQVPVLTDYQGKYTWDIDNNNKFTFAVLGSGDDFAVDIGENSTEALLDPDIVGRVSLDNSFNRQSFTWDSVLESNATLKTALGFYQDEFDLSLGSGQFLALSSDDVILRSKYGFDVNDAHRVSLGGAIGRNTTNFDYDIKIEPCTDFDPNCMPSQDERFQDKDQIKSNFYELFAEDQWRISPSLTSTVGLAITDDEYLKELLVEPRASLEKRLSNDKFFKVATGEYHRSPNGEQIVRNIGNPELDNIKARHLTLGYGEDNKKKWDWNVDVYYKDLYDLAIEDEILNYTNNAEGEAYGVELLLEKHQSGPEDKWFGWFSLSWSRSERTDLNTGLTTTFTGDTPLVLNAVYNYQYSPRWNIGLRYSYRTGAAYTPIVGIEPNADFPDLFQAVYGDLNSERLPNYQQLDVRSEYDFKMFGNQAQLVVDLINLTNHDNIRGVFYEPTPNDTVNNFNVVAEKGLEFFPSIGLRMTF